MGFVRSVFNRRQVGASFFLCQFLGFDLEPFLRPDLHLACRWRAQKLSRLAVAHNPSDKLRRARPHLDSFEHDSTFGAIGMTIRGEPAFGRDSIAPQPCIRWVQDPNHDAVMRIGSEAPRRRTILHSGMKARKHVGTPPLERHRRPAPAGGQGRNCGYLGLPLMIRAQNYAVRHHAFPHERHRPISSLRAKARSWSCERCGRSRWGSKPLRQGAVLLDMRNRHANWIMLVRPSVCRNGPALSPGVFCRSRRASP